MPHLINLIGNGSVSSCVGYVTRQVYFPSFILSLGKRNAWLKAPGLPISASVPRADLLRGVVADAFDRWPNGAVEEHTPRAFVQYARRWMETGVHLMAADQGASAEHVAALRGLIATEWK